MDGTWQTNFLGPFLLTELLGRLRQKQQHSPVRVVHVSSRLEKRSELHQELLDGVAKNQVRRRFSLQLLCSASR